MHSVFQTQLKATYLSYTEKLECNKNSECINERFLKECYNLNLSEGPNRRLKAKDRAFEGSESIGKNDISSSCIWNIQ